MVARPPSQIPPTPEGPGFGAFVISLDFELHWGVRDLTAADGSYGPNLRGARGAVLEMLRLFEDHGVAATWATVGLLFASSREEQLAHAPAVRPTYDSVVLDPYREPVGAHEKEDPLHYAQSLVEAIKATPRQEVGSHTYSHYYCLEPGQTVDQFAADLDSACSIADARGVTLRSLVFPRNQVNRQYREVLTERGFLCFRDGQRGWCYRQGTRSSLPHRAGRWLDSYAPATSRRTTSWEDLRGPRPVALPANRFLRPTTPAVRRLDPLKLRRIGRALDEAASAHRVFHLWWHPHNFGQHLELNISVLRRVLERYTLLAERDGLRSLSMSEVAELTLASPS